MVGLLQAAYAQAGDAIVANGGQIRKYMGDAILFTVPEAGGAARAARAIAESGPYRVAEWELRFRVGVASGEVAVTTVGHSSLLVEDIIGHTVNRAAQMLEAAKASPTGVALDEATERQPGPRREGQGIWTA